MFTVPFNFVLPWYSLTAQSTFMGFGTFLVTGVTAAVSIGTNLAVLKPKTWGDHGKSCVLLDLPIMPS
jgi:hypothetical protein